MKGWTRLSCERKLQARVVISLHRFPFIHYPRRKDNRTVCLLFTQPLRRQKLTELINDEENKPTFLTIFQSFRALSCRALKKKRISWERSIIFCACVSAFHFHLLFSFRINFSRRKKECSNQSKMRVFIQVHCFDSSHHYRQLNGSLIGKVNCSLSVNIKQRHADGVPCL